MSPQSPSDHFSSGSSEYARHRPRYPDALFDWLVSRTSALRTAWDCGTGSGQAAVAIARHAKRVIATDISESQIANAARHPRVEYLVCAAERAPIASRSIGLVTVAQALHWFDTDAFFEEVRRVLIADGLFATWTYGDVSLGDSLDPLLAEFTSLVQPYWPPERAHVQAGYRTIDIPVAPIDAPEFVLEQHWRLDELLGYIGTWSAVARFRSTNSDPLPLLRRRFVEMWGDPENRRLVRWPLTIRVGMVK